MMIGWSLNKMDISAIVTAILTGELDRNLPSIIDACQTRGRIVKDISAAVNMSCISTGDTVKLVNLRPKYLEGALAKITGQTSKKLNCTMLETRRKYREGSAFSVSPNCVEVIK